MTFCLVSIIHLVWAVHGHKFRKGMTFSCGSKKRAMGIAPVANAQSLLNVKRGRVWREEGEGRRGE